MNQVLATTVASTSVAWIDPATLTTVLQDGDADTKITVDVGDVDEDHIRMSTLNLERLTIDNAGEVGIGTNTPDRNLHVAGAANNPGKILIARGLGTTSAGAILGELQFDSEEATSNSTTDASALIRGIASESHGNSNKGGHMAFLTKVGGGASGAASAIEHMRITNLGNVGIGTTSPGSKFEIEGDFYNQELIGASRYNSAQNVAYNASANTVIDISGTDYVRITKADGNGTNGSSILIVASVTVSGNSITFADGVGGYQQVYALMNGMATFTVSLQRRVNSGAWSTVLRQSAICGLAIGDWYSQYNGIANMQGKHGDEYRFPNSVSLSYFDNPTDGTIDYRLIFSPGGERKNGGQYQISDRNLTAVQIKR